MEATITLQKIQENFENEVIEVHSRFQQDTAVIESSSLLQVATFLKEDPELQYNTLMDLTAVDYWKRKPRFEVVYHFLSMANSFRIRLKVPVAEPEPKVDTLTSLWPGANWYEREAFDLFGIMFDGHPDLRRLLTDYGFQGHPFRKPRSL